MFYYFGNRLICTTDQNSINKLIFYQYTVNVFKISKNISCFSRLFSFYTADSTVKESWLFL